MAVGTTVSIGGLVVTNLTISGSVDELIGESGAENTVPQKKEAYNPRMEATIEALDDGYTPSDTFQAKGLTFRTTNVQRSRTTGDVAKYSISGIHYPNIT